MRWIRKKHRYSVGDDMSVEVMEPRLLLSADALGVDAGVLDGDAQADDWDLISASAWWGFDAIDSGVDRPGNLAVEHAWADRQQPPEIPTLNADSAQQSVEEDTLDSLITVPSIDAEQIRYREIIFLDAGVDDGEQLLTDLMGSADADLFQVYLIDSTSDGVAQMTTILNGLQGLDAIHIISHGAAGQIQLGSTTLANDSFSDYAGQLSEWGSALAESGDILIYGCDLAADVQGKALVDAISVATGADVAASTDQTGNIHQGGDWDLEYRPGAIETAAFAMTGTEAWSGVLALVNVTTFNDLADGGDTSSIADLIATPGTDGISLREAIIASNNDSGVADTIALSAGTYTLAIAGTGEDVAATGDLDILDPLTITGVSADQTIIDGAGLDRVFQVIASSAFNVTMSDLKIQNGLVDNQGAGIHIGDVPAAPVVTLTNVWFSGNDTTGIFDSGGAIFNEGDLTIVDSLIEGNSARDGGGVMNYFGGVLSMTNVTLSDNQTTGGDGGGLFNASTATLLNVTVANNGAVSEGGGLHNYNLGGATTKINNTLVADNTASSNPDVDGAFVSNTGDNLIEDVGTATGLHGSDIKGSDPSIGLLSDNGGDTFTHALLIGSAAINAGSTSGAPATDQRGYARDSAADIGAFEFKNARLLISANGAAIDNNAATFNPTDIAGFNDPDLSYELGDGTTGTTDGSFSTEHVLPENIRAIHYVDTPVTVDTLVGAVTGTYNLVAGQIVLSMRADNKADFSLPTVGGGTITVNNTDLLVYSPGTGEYEMLLEDAIFKADGTTPANIHAITIVENYSEIGVDTVLEAGTYILAGSDPAIHANITTYNNTDGRQDLLLGAGFISDPGKQIQGLEFIEDTVSLGGTSLNQGSLLVTVTTNNNDPLVIGTTGQTTVSANQIDVVALTIVATEQDSAPDTVVDAQIFFDGSDIGLSVDDSGSPKEINGIALADSVSLVNNAPTATNLSTTSSYNEGDVSVAITNIVVSDVDGGETITATLTLANTTTGSLSANDGATYTAGTGVWTITDSVANVNTELANLVFNPTTNNDLDTTISITIDDGDEDASGALTGVITLDVTSVNDAPVLGTIGGQSINELATLTFTATATDIDLPGDTLTYSLDASSIALGMSINPTSGDFSWTPTEAQGGLTPSVTITVTDDGTGNLVDSEIITITVNEVNTAPVLGAIGNQSIDELATLSFTASATDSDDTADNLSFSLDAPSIALGMSIDPTNGDFSWTPTEAQGGLTPSVTITVTDDGTGNLVDSEVITITVNDINDAPVLGAIGDQSIDELATLTFTATATDSDDPADNLSFSLDAPSIALGMSIDPTNGDFSWTPTESQGGLTPSVTITVTDDGTGNLVDSEVITITVNDINDAPVLGAIGNQSIDELATLSFNASATDSDQPVDTLTYTLDASSIALGMTINPGTGAFSWTPTEGQGGLTPSVTITVTDDGTGNLTDSEIITITVNEVNVAPVLGAIGNQSIDELATLSFTASATDNDDTADGLSFSLDAPSIALGMSIDPTSGVFSWTPTEGQSGLTPSATVSVTDDGTGNLVDSEIITITVNEVNVAPVLGTIGTQSIDELATLSFTASATDSDLPGNDLTYTLDASSIGLGMTINPGTGAFSWTPTEDQGGLTPSVTITVTDDGTGNLVDSEVITITVNEVNNAPVLDAIGNQSIDELATLSFTATATDGDLTDDTLTYTLDAGSIALGMTINPATGDFSWTTTEAQGGLTPSVTVTVTDDGAGNLVDNETFTITVNEVNVAPVATNLNSTSLYDEGATSVVINDIVVSDGDTAEVISATLTLANTATGSLNATDGATYNAGTGVWTITDTVADVNTALANLVFNPTTNNDLDTTISITIDDGDEDASGALTGTVALSVTAQNDEQIVAVNMGATVVEGSTGSIIDNTLLDTIDVDNSAVELVYTVTAVAGNGTLNLSGSALNLSDTFTQDDIDNSRITYDHDGSETTNDSFNFSVDDGAGSASTGTFSLTITAQNDAPTQVGSIPDQTAIEDNAFSFQIANGTFQDNDAGDSLTYSVSLSSGAPLPDWLHFDAGTRTFSGIPSDADAGTMNILVTALDSSDSGVTVDFNIEVIAVNDAPIFGNHSIILDSGATVTLTAAMLPVSDIDNADMDLILTVSGVSGGQFELISETGTAISSFNYSQVISGSVVFIDDGDDIPPVYSVAVSDGEFSIGPISANVSFSAAPPIAAANELPLDQTPAEPVVPTEAPMLEPLNLSTGFLDAIQIPAEKIPDANKEEASVEGKKVSESTAETIVYESNTVHHRELITADSTEPVGVTAAVNSLQGMLAGLLAQHATILQLVTAPFELDRLDAEIRLILVSDGFRNSLDRMSDGINDATFIKHVAIGSSVVVTSGLSVGYVAWLVRGGVLLGTALSSLPAWQFIDPLPILSGSDDTNDRDERGNNNDSLEEIINDQTERTVATQDETYNGEALPLTRWTGGSAK